MVMFNINPLHDYHSMYNKPIFDGIGLLPDK